MSKAKRGPAVQMVREATRRSRRRWEYRVLKYRVVDSYCDGWVLITEGGLEDDR